MTEPARIPVAYRRYWFQILAATDTRGRLIEETVDESALVMTTGELDNENEHTRWVEYRFPGSDVVVHRSVEVNLKKWPAGMEAFAGSVS